MNREHMQRGASHPNAGQLSLGATKQLSTVQLRLRRRFSRSTLRLRRLRLPLGS